MREDDKSQEQQDETNDFNDRDGSQHQEGLKLQRVPMSSDQQRDIYLGSSLLVKQDTKEELMRANAVELETSQMLVHALHYEVNLMRKAFQVIQANSLVN